VQQTDGASEQGPAHVLLASDHKAVDPYQLCSWDVSARRLDGGMRFRRHDASTIPISPSLAGDPANLILSSGLRSAVDPSQT
jgi:hypothetical protein